MKILPADKYFSLCVRERSAWVCEKCGTQYESGARGLHCSHYIGRGHYATRFEPLNAFSHCFGCHAQLEGNPCAFVQWVKNKLGEELHDLVIEKSENAVLGKEARRAVDEIARHYKAEYERLLKLRAEGIVGRIEFVGF